MTKGDFFKALAKTVYSLKWEYSTLFRGYAFVGEEPIRFCPITAVCYELTGEVYQLEEVVDAAMVLGLPTRVRENIVEAADWHTAYTRNNKAFTLQDRKRLQMYRSQMRRALKENEV